MLVIRNSLFYQYIYNYFNLIKNNMKTKIKISKISKKCYSQKGFDSRGCYGCNCDDSCCKYGADFDKEAYDLVIQNKKIIEPLVECQVEKCFESKFSNDKEFLGENSIRSLKGKNGFCVFHNKNRKGCILYKLVNTKGINKRIIPSICRLFPLSWENSTLIVYNELENTDQFPLATIPIDCNCMELENTTSNNLVETQKKEIDDIFDINEIKGR